MTLIETIDLARDLLNEPLDSSRTFPDNTSNFYRDDVMQKYFNQAQQEVANIIVQSFENYFVSSTTISLVKDQDEYTLNSSVIKIVRVEWITNGTDNPIEILPVSFNDKEMHTGFVNGITAAGEVRVYTIKGNSLILKPTPRSTKASAVKVFFSKKLPDLSAASSVSEVPNTYHEILSWGIVKKALFQQEAQSESILAANNEYNRLIAQMKQWIENRQIQRPRQVKRRKFRRF